MSSGKPDEFDGELDLLDTYKKMVEIQADTLNGIDQKAVKTARLIGLLIGLLLSAGSIVATSEIKLPRTTAFLLLLTVAVAALVVSFVYALLTYLTSKIRYGPDPEIGRHMSRYEVADQDYVDTLLVGYSSAVRDNTDVIESNSGRFANCLGALSFGVLNTVGATATVVSPENPWLNPVIVIVSLAVGGILAWYVVSQEYLTLEN